MQWEAIAQKCTRHTTRFIAPRTLSVPDIYGISRFIPARLPQMLAFNTALSVLAAANPESRNFSITLCDRTAVLPSELHRLLPFASSVRVITSRPERYAKACVDAFVSSGASILLRQSYEPPAERDVVICADGIIQPGTENSAVFAFGKKIGSAVCFSCSQIELLPEHRGIIPVELDCVDFAGALYELCGSGEYAKSVAAKIEITPPDPAHSRPSERLSAFLDK